MIKIGIDPDVTKSGVALKDNAKIELYNMSFFKLFDYLQAFQGIKDVEVYVECGFLNKSNWHYKSNMSKEYNGKIAGKTHENFQVAKKICEMCEHLGLTHFKVKPKKSKVNAEFFRQITKIETRTNQEQRDAFMIIY